MRYNNSNENKNMPRDVRRGSYADTRNQQGDEVRREAKNTREIEVGANFKGTSKNTGIVKKCISKMLTVPDDLKNKPREKLRFHTKDEKEKKPLPISFIFMTVIFTILCMYMLLDMVRINEFTIEVAEMRAELSELAEKKKELSAEIDAKNDLIAIEQRAKELGMVKKDQVEKKYITTEDDDKIEMEANVGNKVSGLFTLMDSLSSNFKSIMEYIN